MFDVETRRVEDEVVLIAYDRSDSICGILLVAFEHHGRTKDVESSSEGVFLRRRVLVSVVVETSRVGRTC